jgi:catechol 2,3-dioxygenase-like lactoylglutathione lyase family enzyme
MNPFGHIDLRVADMAAARPFYAALLPALGFVREDHGEEWKVWATEDELPGAAYYAITEDRGHAPNASRIAFWAASRQDVDRVVAVVRDAGGLITDGPRLFPEYSGAYYAVYFEDPSGNRLEIVHRTM